MRPCWQSRNALKFTKSRYHRRRLISIIIMKVLIKIIKKKTTYLYYGGGKVSESRINKIAESLDYIKGLSKPYVEAGDVVSFNT